MQGCDGEIVRSIDISDIFTIKLSVQQTSSTNKYLEQQREKDRTDGTGYFSVNIKDIVGNESFTAATAWVTKAPSWVRGKENNNRVWEIVAAEGEFNI